MSTVTGIISEVNNRGRGKGSNIVIDGKKYGAFDPVEAGIDQCVVGEEVSFDTSQNGQYTNIVKGTLTKTGKTGTPAPASSGSKGGYQGKASGRPWPIPTLDGQRSIIRQNSLTHATSMVNTYCLGCANDMSLEDRYQRILEFAHLFEEFSAGDDIAKAVEAATKQLDETAE